MPRMLETVFVPLASILIVSTGAIAAPMTGFADFDAGYTLIDFNDLAPGTVVDDIYSARGLTISGTNGSEGTGTAVDVLVYSGYSNCIGTGGTYDYWDGSIIFDLDDTLGITQFGLHIIDPIPVIDPTGDWLSVYDVGGNLLETVYASSIDYSEFIGIDAGSATIGFALLSGYYFAADDVAFNRGAPVPETATGILLGAALAGFAGLRLRRK